MPAMDSESNPGPLYRSANAVPSLRQEFRRRSRKLLWCQAIANVVDRHLSCSR